MINQLREKIFQELQQVEWVAVVYDGIPEKFTGFPTIFFSFDRVEGEVLDSNHHERVYYFQINLFQESSTFWLEVSEKNLGELLDDVIDRFDRCDLWAMVMKIDAVWGKISSVQTECWPTLHAVVVLWIHIAFNLR